MKRWLAIASMMVVACSAPYVRVATAGDTIAATGDTEKLCPTALVEAWWSAKASARDLTAVLSADPRPVSFRGPSYGIEALIELAFDSGAPNLTAVPDPRPVRFRGPSYGIEALIGLAFDSGAQDLTAVLNADPRPVRFRGPIHEIDAPLVAKGD